ncbi:MAG: FxsA family protein [Gammaproteobacteria bacterium]|nr:FxsA family protein [Gammaproteobacteria bacterium]
MRALTIFFLLFLLVPIFEIYLLIQVGGSIGALPTIALVVLTAVVGSALIRHQGLSTWGRARQGMASGQMPALEMLEGVGLLIAGALLLTPGFFTDTIGFILLVPILRRALITSLLRNAVTIQMRGQAYTRTEESRDPRTYEGEFSRDDNDRLR